MPPEELKNYLQQQAKSRGLSLRSLSIKAGLSASTVSNIVNRQYQPTIFSLNRLADFLRVDRLYLWQLAGLIEDSEAQPEYEAQMKYECSRLKNLTRPRRDVALDVLRTVIDSLETKL